MGSLFIDRSDLALASADGVLRVRRVSTGAIERDVPMALLDRVVIRAKCDLDSGVLADLAACGVAVILLHGRAGQKVAQVLGSPHNDARRRWAQIVALANPAVSAALARVIVRAKVRQQKATLRWIQSERPDLRKPLFDGLNQLSGVAQTLATEHDLTTARIRGLEGAAASAYFKAYFACFAPRVQPAGRTRRPPRDPVNAMLSLGYTLLHAQAVSACWGAGLDPALGALHEPCHGRAALACDLMEPWRPAIDLWIWELFRTEALRPEHFAQDGAGACLLGKAGRGQFWPAWNQRADRSQRRLDRYAQALARVLQARMTELIPADWLHTEDLAFETE